MDRFRARLPSSGDDAVAPEIAFGRGRGADMNGFIRLAHEG